MIRFVVRKIKASKQNKADANQEGNETTPDPGVDAHRPNDQHVETGEDGAAKTASEVPIEKHTENEDTPKEPTPSSWQIWKPRVLLLVAVFLPVFLETLDYTGKSLSYYTALSPQTHCHFRSRGNFTVEHCLRIQSSRLAILHRYRLCSRVHRLPPALRVSRGCIWKILGDAVFRLLLHCWLRY
jgi:hypothetical protein